MTTWRPLASARPRSQAGSRPTPGRRQVDEPAPAGLPVPRELVEDDRLVAGQLPVIPATLDVPQRDLGVLVRQGEPERVGLDRAEDGLDVGHGPRCYAVATALREAGRMAPAASSSSRMASRAPLEVGRPVGVARLDALEHQAVEQGEEARGSRRRRRARPAARRWRRPGASSSGRRRPAVRGGPRASRGRPGSRSASAQAWTSVICPGAPSYSSIVSTYSRMAMAIRSAVVVAGASRSASSSRPRAAIWSQVRRISSSLPEK